MPVTAFDHDRDAAWLSAYADGELAHEQAEAVAAHLAGCAACRDELAALRRFDLVMGSLRLKEAPPEAWEAIEHRLAHRSTRLMGWLLLATGATATVAWGLWLGVTALLGVPDLPWWLKAAVLMTAAGALLLTITVLRERLYARRRTRYRDVVR